MTLGFIGEDARASGSGGAPTPPRTTKVDAGAVTPRVTPLGRSLTTDELTAFGRKTVAATWVPSTKPVPTRE